ISGFTLSIKLTGLVLIFPPLLPILRIKNTKKRIYALLLFISILSLVAFPFYLRSWIATGNPIYPYYSEYFTTNPATLAMSKIHHQMGMSKFGSRSIISFFTTFVKLASNPEWNLDGRYGWHLFPLLLLFLYGNIQNLFLKFLKTFKNREEEIQINNNLFLSFYCFFLYLFWFLTAQQARFLLPCYSLMFFLAVTNLKTFALQKKKIILSVIFALFLISFPYTRVKSALFAWKIKYSKISNKKYLHMMIGEDFMSMCKKITTLVPENKIVMLINEHRSLYIPRKCVIGTPLFQEKYLSPPKDFTQKDAVLKHLKRHHISYILVAFNPLNPDRNRNIQKKWLKTRLAMAELLKGGKIKLLWRSSSYSLLYIPD
ncbi:MAG: hypothetical protein U9O87_06715, partial [Verrucomicrobiota bacterium]|nr:hypothetical protein [Verrucomicrobiota bacterium]